MLSVALWMCALLVCVGARIYDRCELARELQQLGIERDHISTWVCIAFHESRFDTSTYNPYSGDHGLLQISELYWCGSGKACGLPCSALRDEDISDDVECALRIHEEHTRIQGDGFLAWVVYPQHCKHNTKKYLVDCDSIVKNTTARTYEKPRAIKTFENNTNFTFAYNPSIDDLKAPYLTIGSIIRSDYLNYLEQTNHHQNNRINWLNFKINNIDQLTLPVFYKKTNIITTPWITTTTIAPFPVIPSRRIETNQFRNKLVTNAAKTEIDSENSFQKFTKSDSLIKETTTFTSLSSNPTSVKYTPNPTSVKYTPSTTITTTTYKPQTTLTTIFKPLTVTAFSKPSTKNQSTTILNQSKPSTTINRTVKPSKTAIATIRPSVLTTTVKPSSFIARKSTTTSRPMLTNNIPRFSFTSRTTTPRSTTKRYNSQNFFSKSLVKSITLKPWIITAAPPTKTKTSTLSIFDLYLNTGRPKLSTYRFESLGDERYKLKIFSGGTTTPVPLAKTSGRSAKAPSGGAERNHFRRQTSLQT